MSGFDAGWLALREPADHRARNADVADALAARFALRDKVSVVDLGCGTGSNLRALSDLLPKHQTWTLVDNDPALLSAARDAISSWADTAGMDDTGRLKLSQNGREIEVTFRNADLAHDLGAVLDPAPDLVTAAALFDLASPEFIRHAVAEISQRRAVFYTVLTYNGIQHWTPRSPLDNRMTGAFNRHQMTDKGFGPSAGPTAPDHLADQFRMAGYSVIEGDSPWRLEAPRDAKLIDELVRGQAAAVAETGTVDQASVDRWVAIARRGGETGHTDTLAVPG